MQKLHRSMSLRFVCFFVLVIHQLYYLLFIDSYLNPGINSNAYICILCIPIFPQNFLIIFIFCYSVFCLLYDQGIPMIYMGDEYGHTKGGNNNTYCHDNFVILYSGSQHYIGYSLS